MNLHLFSKLSAVAILATTITAQTQFNPSIGSSLGLTDDSVSAGNVMLFSYTFPDGTSTTTIDIDSNGRIGPPGMGASDFTEDVVGMLANPSQIMPWWDDINPPAAGGNVFFNALANVTLITWQDVELFAIGGQFTFQCQLHQDGRATFVYDDRTPVDEPLVGVSDGNGAVDTGSMDLGSVAPPPSTTTPTLYEDFLAFDLAGRSVEFIPAGPMPNGWVVISGPSGFPTLASVETSGPACRFAISLLPDGNGGYVGTPSQTFQANFGAPLGITLDDGISTQALGFTFPWPGSTPATPITSTSADIDTNGRLVRPGSGEFSDYNPTRAEFFGDPVAQIAPLWGDFNVNEIGGDIFFINPTPTTAVFTWSGIAQYNGSTPATFQVHLDVSGSITFVYIDVAGLDAAIGLTGTQTVIIGVSAGNGATDPGEQDFSGGVVLGGSQLYEFFDGPANENLDFQMKTVGLSVPRLGTNFDVRIDNIPPGTSAAYLLVGFSNPAIALDVIGIPGCFLLVNPVAPAIAMAFTGSTSSVFTLPISTDPVLEGVPLFVQSISVTPGPFSLPLVFGNGILGTVGF